MKDIKINNDLYFFDEQKLNDMNGDFLASGVIVSTMTKFPPDFRATYKDAVVGLRMKPNLNKECSHLKSLLYDKPLGYSANRGDMQKENVHDFLNKYSINKSYYRTDENGDRVTVPEVNTDKIVLVIGDSIGFGLMLNDEETISSLLQQRDQRVKYINACVPGCDAEDNLKRLRQKLAEYGPRVVGVIYVHCENDFTPLATPEYIASNLSNLLESNNLKYKIFIYQQYTYRTMPDVARKKLEELIKMNSLKLRTLDIVKNNGFFVIDFYDIVGQYRKEKRSLLAGFALYIDHSHFSREGIRVLVSRIPPPSNLP